MSRDDADGATMGFRSSDPVNLEPYLASQPPASDWQARVIEERRDLAEKVEKLVAFLDSRPTHVGAEELDLLQMQLCWMREYLMVLDRRIARF